MTDSLYCHYLGVYLTYSSVLGQPVSKPISMSFISPVGANVTNELSIVQNQHGAIVGQLMSDVINITAVFPISAPIPPVIAYVDICIMRDENIQWDPKYTVFDLATNNPDILMPLGFTSYTTSDSLYCFENVSIVHSAMEFVLIRRFESYEDYFVMTTSEQAILLTTAILYAIGIVVMLFIQFFTAFVFDYISKSLLLMSCQCCFLFAFRSVYFFCLSFQVIDAGSLLDFILVEVPTFFYFGLFVGILIPIIALQYFKAQQIGRVQRKFFSIELICLFCAWLMFAAIVIALSEVTTKSTIIRECACRLNTTVQPSDSALTIRIVYKSIIMVVAFCVFLIMSFSIRKVFSDEIRASLFQMIGISFCLCLNCIAFVIYYSINSPTAYFAIVLWFTELLPVFYLLIILGFPSQWRRIFGLIRHSFGSTTTLFVTQNN